MTNNHSRRYFDSNPFSTSAVKPGAIDFLFSGDESVAPLVAELESNGWRGEIVGPHGSGKSTLLQSLIPLIEARGRDVRCFVCRNARQDLARFDADQANWSDQTQVVVEGYELLNRRARKTLDTVCRRQRSGLLITCHEPQGFPSLFQTCITLELASTLVEQLVPAGCNLITHADVRDSFARRGQNLRELLFEMYDLYEQRRPRQSLS